MSKLSGWKSWVGVFASILIFVSQARASSALNDRGTLMVLIGLTPVERANLDQGRMKLGQRVPLEISFAVPQLGNFQPQSKARIELRPVDSSVQLGQGFQSKPLPVEDSSHSGGVSVEVPLAGIKILSRVAVPVSWLPQGKVGSGIFVRVIIDTPILRSYGQASFHVASSENGAVLSESTPWGIFDAQQKRYSKMKGAERGDQLVTETAAPFDPALFKDALQKDSLEIQEGSN